MDTVIITSVICLSIAVSSLYWGAVFSLRLPELDKWFDRKPFNCRPCLTFHLAWVSTVGASLVTGSLHVLVWGVITAILLFTFLKIIDNKKITK